MKKIIQYIFACNKLKKSANITNENLENVSSNKIIYLKDKKVHKQGTFTFSKYFSAV